MATRKTCTDRTTGHLLARYELDLLEEAEQGRFEQHLLDCPFCRQEVSEFLPAVNHIHAHKEELAERLEAQGLSYESLRDSRLAEASAGTRRKEIRPSFWVLVKEWWGRPAVWAPAVALTCVVLLIVFMQPKSHRPYENFLSFEAMPFEGTLTRGSGAVDMEYYSGVQAYQEHDWASAIHHLTRVTMADSMRGEAWLYLGISQYVERHSRDAILDLERATRWVPRHLDVQARWYLAQAYLLDDRKDEALAQLDSVATSSDSLAQKGASLRARIQSVSP